MTLDLFDSHCHVAEPEFDEDRDEVLARARATGVRGFLVVAAGGDSETSRRAISLAERESDCRAVVGIHPHHAAGLDEALWREVAELSLRPEVVAIGETGLDFHYDFSPRDRQRDAFRRFVVLARERERPLVIHSRNAASETAAILREEAPGGIEGVMHCFTYGPEDVQPFLDLGLHVSFSGIVTFRNAADVRAAARRVPLDRLLVETDSPYLAPEPRRGGRNEPARVADVVRVLAGALERPVEEIAAVTTANARRLFRI
ncbi:MAG: TatD DNase family protein [Candidatus Binatota bacterium]|nr:TatD DNase family protein [Candidatus Binatota bacterium]